MTMKGTITITPVVTMLVKEIYVGSRGTKSALCEFIIGDEPPVDYWIEVGQSWRGDLTIEIGS